jgi:flavin-dependent thymidylate synthase
MKVTLAGFNVPVQSLVNILETGGTNLSLSDISPEIISASYARISRDPRPIVEIRKDAMADVESARKSNESIVFGMGHSSIAEHVVFNFDIVGLSRLAVEELESHRLCSFTEKSQRYIKLDADAYVPEELGVEDVEEFRAFIAAQAQDYEHLLGASASVTKEDARYVLPLAYTAQLGMTCNARNLELIIKRCAAHPLLELRQLAKQLYKDASRVAPSLIRYTEPTAYCGPERRDQLRTVFGALERVSKSNEDFFLFQYPASSVLPHTPDKFIAQALIIANTYRDFFDAASAANKFPEDKLRNILFESLQSFDAPPREFEHLVYSFMAVVSASCFAQLKRHRMATITTQRYNVNGLYVRPQTLPNTGDCIDRYVKSYFRAKEYYNKLYLKYGTDVAEYVVLNGNTRRVMVTMNLREIYHFCRMRQDGHAQWEIRGLANVLADAVKENCPIGALLLCGKDKFEAVYKEHFGEE